MKLTARRKINFIFIFLVLFSAGFLGFNYYQKWAISNANVTCEIINPLFDSTAIDSTVKVQFTCENNTVNTAYKDFHARVYPGNISALSEPLSSCDELLKPGDNCSISTLFTPKDKGKYSWNIKLYYGGKYHHTNLKFSTYVSGWKNALPILTTASLKSILISNTTDNLYATTWSKIYISRDHADTWQLLNTPSNLAVLYGTLLQKNNIYLLGELNNNSPQYVDDPEKCNNVIYKTEDNGESWQDITYNLYNLHSCPTKIITNGDSIHAISYDYTTKIISIFNLSSQKNSWETYFKNKHNVTSIIKQKSERYTGLEGRNMKVSVSDANKIYVGTDLGLYISTDEGKIWKLIGFSNNEINTLAVDNKSIYLTLSNVDNKIVLVK